MIEMAGPVWSLDSVEEHGGEIVAATLIRGDTRIRLVHPNSLLEQISAMDPMGRMLGSIFAECFRGSKLSKEELTIRQASNAAGMVADSLDSRAKAPKRKKKS